MMTTGDCNSRGFRSPEAYVSSVRWELGCSLPHEDWLWLNSVGIFEVPSLRRFAAPFPGPDLVGRTSGEVSTERLFAQHGVDIFDAWAKVSPVPITEFKSLLDFGCGCGRLARMLKGHPNRVVGCDIDLGMIKWVNENLDYMTAVLTGYKAPLPFSGSEFDAIVSISVFTHLTEESQDEFLSELRRVTDKKGYLFLTTHGSRALERAKSEKMIFEMLNVDTMLFERACREFEKNRHSLILQHEDYNPGYSPQDSEANKTPGEIHGCGWFNQMTRRWKELLGYRKGKFQYGIAFHPESYVVRHWSKWFEVLKIVRGAIHDFQDIVVLRPKKSVLSSPKINVVKTGSDQVDTLK
jgi:SAM-dependent methyltransferase